MILLLTTRLKRSLRLSCKAPSKQPLINFYPAIPMSPGSAATQQQKTLIKSFGESFDVTLADFRSPKETLLQEEKNEKKKKERKKPIQNPSLHSPHSTCFFVASPPPSPSFSPFLLQWLKVSLCSGSNLPIVLLERTLEIHIFFTTGGQIQILCGPEPGT